MTQGEESSATELPALCADVARWLAEWDRALGQESSSTDSAQRTLRAQSSELEARVRGAGFNTLGQQLKHLAVLVDGGATGSALATWLNVVRKSLAAVEAKLPPAPPPPPPEPTTTPKEETQAALAEEPSAPIEADSLSFTQITERHAKATQPVQPTPTPAQLPELDLREAPGLTLTMMNGEPATQAPFDATVTITDVRAFRQRLREELAAHQATSDAQHEAAAPNAEPLDHTLRLRRSEILGAGLTTVEAAPAWTAPRHADGPLEKTLPLGLTQQSLAEAVQDEPLAPSDSAEPRAPEPAAAPAHPRATLPSNKAPQRWLVFWGGLALLGVLLCVATFVILFHKD